MIRTLFFATVLSAASLGVSVTLIAEAPACYREIERSFFKPELVTQALSLHDDIYQSTWSQITQDLSRRANNVPTLVRQRAAKMSPNPFGTPYDAEAAGEVLRVVLFEILNETLTLYHITNPNEVNDIFNYILNQQRGRWDACFANYKSVQKK